MPTRADRDPVILADSFEDAMRVMRERGWNVDDEGGVISEPIPTETLSLIATLRSSYHPQDELPIKAYALVSIIDELLALRKGATAP